jgi:predicted RNA-binding Zn ribbon-like protein
MAIAYTTWVPEHFIGGHPALDLANALFNRRVPEQDNELLKSAQDIGNWFAASGLADVHQAEAIASIGGDPFVEAVHAVREASAEVFGTMAAGSPPTAAALNYLFSCAAVGLATGSIEPNGMRPELTLVEWWHGDAVPAFLAALSVEAFFTLPRDRLRSCPRCGWLFLDTSRGGKRRWCSMQTCGNREKVSRHRGHA